MQNPDIRFKKKIKLKDPILIEGLPGLGLVGKLSADHLIKELGATKFADLYSHDFPPQTLIDENGIIRMRKNELYYWEAEKKGQSDLIIFVGDDQGLTVQSQYQICDSVLDLADQMGTKMIYTLGGYGMQKLSKDPKVFGAVTHKELVDKFKKFDVVFPKTPGAIMGAAGLLLGLGALRGMKGICLMGETHGNYVDARAAKNVLKIISDSLNLKITYHELDKKAKETEEMIAKLEALQGQQPMPEGGMPQPEVTGEGPDRYIR